MFQNNGGLRDSLRLGMYREDYEGAMVKDGVCLTGTIELALFDDDHRLKDVRSVKNLITDNGDLYYATMGIAGVMPSNTDAPDLATGMKLGTGTTAAAKNGAGAAIGAGYISGSNKAFDATYPKINNLGAGNGVQAQYVTTWAAGDATNSAITEIAIVTEDISSDTTSLEAETISRAVFSAINKTASDTLVATWNHLFKGAAA